MFQKRIVGAWLVLFFIAAAVRAAEPEFKLAIVTAAWTYERASTSFSVGGIRAAGDSTTMSRVTVALDGLLITGEWEPKTLRSTSARDFRRGAEVPAAVQRNRLLLQEPDGSTLTTKIVNREKQQRPDAER